MNTSSKADIAIIGMAGIFPGAADVETFWHNILNKVDAVTDPPPESWDMAALYDPDSDATDRIYCKKGGFISDLASFNPIKNGVMPNVVDGAEPDQWLALEAARNALTDAGYGDDIPERERTAVIIGRGTYLNRGNTSHYHHGSLIGETLAIIQKLHPDYSGDDLDLIRTELRKGLAPFNASTAQGLIPNIIAGRIANQLDLMGPSYTVDAACASSFIALEHAVKGLRSGEFDMALVGGAHVVTHAPIAMVFCQLDALSRKGMIRPFDANADGTILGEGLGIVVVKRLMDAVQAGHRVYAVVKGVGSASDGKGLSVMAPRLEGEITAMQHAYANTNDVDPRTVTLIEAHGTGTALGDATEIKALTHVFGERDGALPRVAVGAVKSMIGHLMPASGIAGLIKTSLALHHKILPPMLNVTEPDPNMAWEDTSLYLNTETRPWIHGRLTPRRAGVNAFGFGGINTHVVLEEAPTEAVAGKMAQWDSEVVVISAETRPQLAKKLSALSSQLPTVPLKDLAYTLHVERTVSPLIERTKQSVQQIAIVAPDHVERTVSPLSERTKQSVQQITIVATDIDDLAQKLTRASNLLQKPKKTKINDTRNGIYYFDEPLATKGKLAFVFPGEGSQYLNMLADLCQHFPAVRASFDLIDRIYTRQGRSWLLSDIIFPRPAFTKADAEANEARLWEMEGAVEAVLTASHALHTLLTELGIKPDAIVGHSTGEYAALRASGMIALNGDEALEQFALSLNAIHQQMHQTEGVQAATLLACATSAEKIAPLVEQVGAFVGMDNCPHQCVVVGSAETIDQLTPHLREKGIIHEKLSFDRPYHTPLFAEFGEQLKPFFAEWLTNSPAVPTYSCTTVGLFSAETAQQTALDHWAQPVRFRQTIQKMHEDGVRLFVEVGPRGNLSAFVKDILRGQPHAAIAANVTHRSGIEQLNHLVAQLVAHGVEVDFTPLYARRRPQIIDLNSTPKPERGRMKLNTNWSAMTISDEAVEKLRKPSAISNQPSATSHQPSATSNQQPATNYQSQSIPMNHHSSSTDAVMAAYLQTMDRFLQTQEAVMTAFLTGQTAPSTTSIEALPSLPSLPAPPAIAPPPVITNGYHQPTVNYEPPIPPSDPLPLNGHSNVAERPLHVQQSATSNQQSAISNQQTAPRTTTKDTLLSIVSERTGYPPDMLDLDLDMEAELGIDSIKRVEIMGSLHKALDGRISADLMDDLTAQKTLRQVIDLVEATPANFNQGGADAPQNTYPFIRNIIEHQLRQRLVAECLLDIDHDIFLHDHTMGRDLSLSQPDLHGLPVMPMTMTMEMLAQAAAVLAPDSVAIGMQNVFAYRWLVIDQSSLVVRLIAERTSPDSVHVQLFAPDEQRPVAEADVIFAPVSQSGLPHFAPAPIASVWEIDEPVLSKWSPDRLYDDSPMFHGRRFQGVMSLDQLGRDGATATLCVQSAGDLFVDNPSPNLIFDPVLLDQIGQVVGFWGMQQIDAPRTTMAPYALREMQIFGETPSAGTTVTCQASIQLFGGDRVRSDFEVLLPDGRVWIRWRGWEDQLFQMPPLFYHYSFFEGKAMLLSERLPVPDEKERTRQSVQQAFAIAEGMYPFDFFSAFGGIWLRVLAFAVLGQREREQWLALDLPPREALGWLLLRICAKDAVRVYLQEEFGRKLLPPDIEIDAQGTVSLVGGSDLPMPYVGTADGDGLTVALLHPNAPIGLAIGRDAKSTLDKLEANMPNGSVQIIELDGYTMAIAQAIENTQFKMENLK